MGFHYIGQAALKLLISDDPSISASQNAGITGVSHCAWPDPKSYFAAQREKTVPTDTPQELRLGGLSNLNSAYRPKGTNVIKPMQGSLR